MTREDKDLLLKDLCARFAYQPYINVNGLKRGLWNIEWDDFGIVINQSPFGTGHGSHGTRLFEDNRCCVKPYLRPMSSMTEEEQAALKVEHTKDTRLFAEALTRMSNGDHSMHGKVVPHFAVDWCNKNHFDYNNLIEKGLALEATEGMYKTE